MMTQNDAPQSIQAGVRAELEVGRRLYTPTSAPFTQIIPSTLPIEKFVLLGNHSGPQVFGGEVRYEKLKEYSITLQNVVYSGGLAIDEELIKYDQSGLIAMRAKEGGYEWERGKDKLTVETLAYGASSTCYDGTPFFGASHVDLSSGTQSNIGTGASVFDTTVFRVGAQAMALFKDDRGEVMGRQVSHVVVRSKSADSQNAKTLANSTYNITNANFGVNVYQGDYEVVETPYLPSTVNFVLMDLRTPNKPILRTAPVGGFQMNSLEKNSDWYADHKQFKYSWFESWALGYNDWRLAWMQI